jgi:hypothetical protein
MVTMTRHTFLGPRTARHFWAKSRQASAELTVWAATTMPRTILPRFVCGSFIGQVSPIDYRVSIFCTA